MSSGHFIERCCKCDKVVLQCRCPSANKKLSHTKYPCVDCQEVEDPMTKQKCKCCKKADAIFKERGGNLLTNHIYMEHCICEPTKRTGKMYVGCPFCAGDKL
jgi:hypothetical protein